MSDQLRKAAILIDSLDTQSADALLDQMGEQRAALVRQTVVDLPDVDPDERQTILEEFLRGPQASHQTKSEGVELDRSLAARISSGNIEPEPAKNESGSFQFLCDADGETLVSCLRHEHPQTIAVVLSHLPPARAADVLSRLPSSFQTEVLSRVAELDQTDPEIIREIEVELQTWLADKVQSNHRRLAGLASARAILDAVGGVDREEILANLSEVDRSLASRLSFEAPLEQPRLQEFNEPVELPIEAEEEPAPLEAELPEPESLQPPAIEFSFDELATLDDRSLARVFQASDPSVTLLALTGARREFVDRIMSSLPAREAKMLRRQMQQTGPLRLSDIDEAQRQLAQLAGQLLVSSKVPAPQSRRFTAAA